MDNRMYMEGRIKAPGAQPSPGMSATSKRPGAEPTLSGVSQVVFPDAAGMDSREQPSSAPGGPEKGPRPRESSEEGPLELRTQQQMHPAGPRKKESTPAPQEGPKELQAGWDQAKPGSELGVLPSRVPAAHEGKENEDQQGRQKHPGTVKGQAPQSRQRTALVFHSGHDLGVLGSSPALGSVLRAVSPCPSPSPSAPPPACKRFLSNK
uniref:Uncharacterized protein n=1 Tax=Ailuropoda melanoleuca TaxID=9646 RepID=A0A7N5JBD6_AILME